MIKTALFSALIALSCATYAAAQSPSAPAPASHFASGEESLNIAIEVVADGLVFVQAKVNEHAGSFIVDNGTQGFIVDLDFAKRASLLATGTASTRGVGTGATDTGVIRDVTIALPGLELTHRNLLVLELQSLEPSVGHKVDGIIGSRLFDDFVVGINYENQRMSIYTPARFVPSGKETVLPVRVDAHGFQYIDATVTLPGAAPVSGSFLVDGGANYYANLYKPFSDAHRLPPATMKLVSPSGASSPREGLAERIDVGPFSIEKAAITFAQDTEGLMASKDYAGLIGAEFWERFTVVWDSRGKRIWLTPNRSYRDPAEYDHSGIRIRAEGEGFHHFVVNRVVAQSPAEEAGIAPGDVIESIDLIPAQQVTLSELRGKLRKPGARCTIGIRRGEKQMSVTLQLRPLL